MSDSVDKKRQEGLRKRAGKHYQKSSGLNAANRLDLLILAHDAAILAAKSRNRLELEKALRILIEGLDLAHMPHFALGLFKVYNQCDLAAVQPLRCASAGRLCG